LDKGAHSRTCDSQTPPLGGGDFENKKKPSWGEPTSKISGRRPENFEKNTPEMYPKLQIKANL